MEEHSVRDREVARSRRVTPTNREKTMITGKKKVKRCTARYARVSSLLSEQMASPHRCKRPMGHTGQHVCGCEYRWDRKKTNKPTLDTVVITL